MKRLAVFCDGTWNRLATPHPTNVVLAASAVALHASEGTQQLTYYSEGVGTSYLISEKLASRAAGGFGLGLFDKVADAYRFLVLNWEIGDEIYIFGFSRGAYTARSLAGMIRNCGIIARDHFRAVPRAHAFYRGRTPDMKPDSEAAFKFRATHAYRTLMGNEEREWRREHKPRPELEQLPLFEITYLGVWDTVGALGIPQHLFAERILQSAQKYRFHDYSLTSRVASAGHAVAIDEDRKSFIPTLWDNIELLEEATGREGRYQQLWFPGDHGSVGGGGEIEGLSAGALLWVVEGAQLAGLEFADEHLKSWRTKVDPLAPLRNNTEKPTLFSRVYRRAPRSAVNSWSDLSEPAVTRLMSESKSLSPRPYRPPRFGSCFQKSSGAKGTSSRCPDEPS